MLGFLIERQKGFASVMNILLIELSITRAGNEMADSIGGY